MILRFSRMIHKRGFVCAFHFSMIQHKKAFFNTLHRMSVKIIYIYIWRSPGRWGPSKLRNPDVEYNRISAIKEQIRAKSATKIWTNSQAGPQKQLLWGMAEKNVGKKPQKVKNWRNTEVPLGGYRLQVDYTNWSQVGPTMGLWASAAHVKATNQLFTQRSENKIRIKPWKPPLNPLQVAF